MYHTIIPAPRIPIGRAQRAPYTHPMRAPTAPMIAQMGENAPAASFAKYKLFIDLSWIRNRILSRSDRPEKMVARMIIFTSKIVVREKTNG
jgi:hypothetical protein